MWGEIDISVKELVSAVVASVLWGGLCQGQQFCFHSDIAKSMLKSSGKRVPLLLGLLQMLCITCDGDHSPTLFSQRQWDGVPGYRGTVGQEKVW